MLGYSVDVNMIVRQEKMYYNNVLVLSYKIEFPQFQSIRFFNATETMNEFYRIKASEYERYCRNDLFNLATKQYNESRSIGVPARPFEALNVTDITYNQNCSVSLYMDRYEYTGGAHGNTLRRGDTWDLQSYGFTKLQSLFVPGFNYIDYILAFIEEEIKRQINEGNNIYFDNYEENIAEYFNIHNYFLTGTGISIFFQQYQIAPYAVGIPQFIIPFVNPNVVPPKCT